jgi:hypothetical protein
MVGLFLTTIRGYEARPLYRGRVFCFWRKAMEDETKFEFSQEQLDGEPLLKFFGWKHLSNQDLQDTSKAFCALALLVVDMPRNAERSACLRKLLEAKDCAVRALL